MACVNAAGLDVCTDAAGLDVVKVQPAAAHEQGDVLPEALGPGAGQSHEPAGVRLAEAATGLQDVVAGPLDGELEVGDAWPQRHAPQPIVCATG